MVIFNGSEYEQSIMNVLENMVPDAMPDAEMIMHTMLCCKDIARWDHRRRLIMEGHTIPNTDVAELLEYVVLPYNKNIPKPHGLELFSCCLNRIGVDTKHIGNQCVRLVVESGGNVSNNSQAGDSSLVVEPDEEANQSS